MTYFLLSCYLSLSVLRWDEKNDWPQYGGPRQDFIATDATLQTDWGGTQPPILWERPIGEGFSGISVVGDRLYTMHRTDDREVVWCLSARDGHTLWEFRYETTLPEKIYEDFGKGPRATPLVHGGAVYTVGFAGLMHALDAQTGKVLWQRDLWRDFPATKVVYGYSSGPVWYEDSLILLLGGADAAVVSLDFRTGTTRWKKHSFTNGYSTPRVIQVGGMDHLVCVMNDVLAGLDPRTGELHWTCAHESPDKSFENIAMPAYGADGLLFFSSPKREARSLRLAREGDRVRFSEEWTTPKIRAFHPSTVRVGDRLYGSSGITGPGFLFCAHAQTGRLLWRERGLATAKLLYADGRLVILDENGDLVIGTPENDKLTIHGRWNVLTSRAWTIPTLVGSTLYLRDQKVIKALNLGPNPSESGPAGKPPNR